MRDDPHRNLKWLEQELLEADRPAVVPKGISNDTAQLLAQVDGLLEELPDVEPPAFVQKRKKPTRGEQMERSGATRKLDDSDAVFTKTKRQLRKEKQKQKRDHVNRNIKDLVVLAILEIIGILCVIGWWLQ